jgi:hypothetical protein
LPSSNGAPDFLSGTDHPAARKAAAAVELCDDGKHTPAQSPSTLPKRPVGLVWIVFYWGFTGVVAALFGIAVQWAGGFIGGISSVLEDSGPLRSSTLPGGKIAAEVAGFGGILLFHIGLITLVACYGLWTFRKWALPVAKVLAVVFGVGAFLAVIVALVVRHGIMVGLTNLAISIAVIMYLFGSSNISERLKQYSSNWRGVGGREWDGFVQ